MLCIATACSSLSWADEDIGSGTKTISAWADGTTNSTNYYTSSTGTATLKVIGPEEVNDSYINTYSGVIRDGDSGGKVGLTIVDNSYSSFQRYKFQITEKQSYSGETTISHQNMLSYCAIVLSNEGTLGSGDITCDHHAVLEFKGHGYTDFTQNLNNFDLITFDTTSDMTISGSINTSEEDPSTYSYSFTSLNVNPTVVTDAGTLTISGENKFRWGTRIFNGTLKLTGDGTLGTGFVDIDTNGTLEVNVASGEDKTFTNSIYAYYGQGGTVKKTGEGTLKLDTETGGSITVEKFIQTAGELDIKGTLTGSLELEGGTFSPGNSVGDIDVSGATNITGSALMTFEIASDSSYDTLTTGTLDVDKYGFIKLEILNTFEDSAEIPIITYSTLDAGTYTDVSQWLNSAPANWSLTSHDNAIYAKFTAGDPTTSVPEPSTWALLIMGFAGLMWYRKRERR